MDKPAVPEAPGAVSSMPPEQQAHRLGNLYTDSIDGWGKCEKKRAKLIDWIMGE